MKMCKLQFYSDKSCVLSGYEKLYVPLQSSHPLEHLGQIQEIRT